jgi:hypothetical protein
MSADIDMNKSTPCTQCGGPRHTLAQMLLASSARAMPLAQSSVRVLEKEHDSVTYNPELIACVSEILVHAWQTLSREATCAIALAKSGLCGECVIRNEPHSCLACWAVAVGDRPLSRVDNRVDNHVDNRVDNSVDSDVDKTDR